MFRTRSSLLFVLFILDVIVLRKFRVCGIHDEMAAAVLSDDEEAYGCQQKA